MAFGKLNFGSGTAGATGGASSMGKQPQQSWGGAKPMAKSGMGQPQMTTMSAPVPPKMGMPQGQSGFSGGKPAPQQGGTGMGALGQLAKTPAPGIAAAATKWSGMPSFARDQARMSIDRADDLGGGRPQVGFGDGSFGPKKVPHDDPRQGGGPNLGGPNGLEPDPSGRRPDSDGDGIVNYKDPDSLKMGRKFDWDGDGTLNHADPTRGATPDWVDKDGDGIRNWHDDDFVKPPADGGGRQDGGRGGRQDGGGMSAEEQERQRVEGGMRNGAKRTGPVRILPDETGGRGFGGQAPQRIPGTVAPVKAKPPTSRDWDGDGILNAHDDNKRSQGRDPKSRTRQGTSEQPLPSKTPAKQDTSGQELPGKTPPKQDTSGQELPASQTARNQASRYKRGKQSSRNRYA
jgi:hypothetical protein